jgi:hypothetical protein
VLQGQLGVREDPLDERIGLGRFRQRVTVRERRVEAQVVDRRQDVLRGRRDGSQEENGECDRGCGFHGRAHFKGKQEAGQFASV